MENVVRVTLSLPDSLLHALDDRLTRDGESRSAAVRRLLELALHTLDEQGEVDQYIAGYREQPQTEDEFGWSDDVVRERLAEVPWR
jgi:metal-responsive CopG/Arc/MetJ family transcriptional regulator